MTVDEQTLQEIIDIEWDMFHNVRSIDGPAACQEDPKTFELMRSSQIKSWSQEVAASYLDDLRSARAQDRNLMTEKYARMMQYTAPCEFRRIEPSVRPLEPAAEAVIERLLPRLVEWQEEVVAKYPHVGAQGRPIRSSEDDRYTTSFETYTRGELATYSAKTLQLLEEHYLQMAAMGENPAEHILRNTVQRYGYKSIERAEEVQKARMEDRTAR
jgi:hypothetical protein